MGFLRILIAAVTDIEIRGREATSAEKADAQDAVPGRHHAHCARIAGSHGAPRGAGARAADALDALSRRIRPAQSAAVTPAQRGRGAPRPDEASMTLSVLADPDKNRSFTNIRVEDIQACYKLWKSRGAEFITEVGQSI
jgi:hypothetical protein